MIKKKINCYQIFIQNLNKEIEKCKKPNTSCNRRKIKMYEEHIKFYQKNIYLLEDRYIRRVECI